MNQTGDHRRAVDKPWIIRGVRFMGAKTVKKEELLRVFTPGRVEP
jgi:hypothetical protein